MSQNSFLNRNMNMWFLILLFPTITFAHPVTFKDGQEISINNFSNQLKLSYTYSFTNNYSLGFSYLKMIDKDYSLLDYNYLFKRWNEVGSQANFYGGISAGEGNDKAVFGGFVEADWESREKYISFKTSYVDSNYMIKTRLGMAPYLAEYKELNTWFMVEYVYMSQDNFQEINPLLRFFYKNLLWEMGVGLKGNILFNFMIHL